MSLVMISGVHHSLYFYWKYQNPSPEEAYTTDAEGWTDWKMEYLTVEDRRW